MSAPFDAGITWNEALDTALAMQRNFRNRDRVLIPPSRFSFFAPAPAAGPVGGRGRFSPAVPLAVWPTFGKKEVRQ